jgi:hypothetical protein
VLLAPHGCHGPAGAGRLAVAEALQDFCPDGFLNLLDPLFPDVLVGVIVIAEQWVNDIGFAPQVEFLHERSLFFGHMFVPFGRLEFFGSVQLALLTARVV